MANVEGLRLSEAAEELARTLTSSDLDEALIGITSAAVDVLPEVDFASITIRHEDGRLRTVAATHAFLERLDAAQYQLQEGPCYSAGLKQPHVVSTDLANDERFPRYAEVAVTQGVRAQVGVRIFDAVSASGAVNLFSRTPGAFANADLDGLSELFAERSSELLSQAQDRRGREVAALRDAASSHDVVGRAVGIAMERYGMTEPRAFALLARLAEHHGTDLAVVAGAMIRASQERAD